MAAGHEVSLVLTQPDRRAGRGMRISSSEVAQKAGQLGIPVQKPVSLRQGDPGVRLRELRPDALVVAAYGLLLPAAVLEIPLHGCLNIHASLLPRWRGAAPIQRALLAGDALTGVSIMQMDAGLDTGPVLLEREHAIGQRETAGSLTGALAELGALAIVEALRSLDSLTARGQDSTKATYAPKIAKAEARLDWTRSNHELDRQVRAFDPAPGAETSLASKTLKVREAYPVEGSGKPGQVLESDSGRLVIACGQGALSITRLQRPGGKPLSTEEFVRGTRIERGALLDPASAAV